jgi:hypothetical protein
MRFFRSRKGRESADERGQSTLEFALAMIFVIAFLLFFFQLSMIFAWGSYVHYATFMAARAYLSAGSSQDDQRSRAREVIVRMLKKSESLPNQDRLPAIAVGTQGQQGVDITGMDIDPTPFDSASETKSWLQGVRYTFKSKLFLMPFGKPSAASSGSANRITLKAESFLGREPSDQECASGMKSQWSGQQQDNGSYYDNGC